MLDFRQTRFVLSAPTHISLPPDIGAEVALAGRSNAGKSTAINALTDQRALARVSKTPGRTQMLNCFEIDDQHRLIDLPGYGYAEAPKDTRHGWEQAVGDYLRHRASLRGLMVIMDIRHPLTARDELLLDWCREADLPAHILLNKADKLSRGAALTARNAVAERLRLSGQTSPVTLFSGLRRQGVDAVREALDQWLTGG